MKPQLLLRYHKAPALTLRSRRVAGHTRGEDAIVPCLIHSSTGSSPTRFLFRKRGASLPKMGDISSPSVQNVEQERRNFVLPRNSYDDFELNGHIKCLNVRYDTCGVVTNSYVN